MQAHHVAFGPTRLGAGASRAHLGDELREAPQFSTRAACSQMNNQLSSTWAVAALPHSAAATRICSVCAVTKLRVAAGRRRPRASSSLVRETNVGASAKPQRLEAARVLEEVDDIDGALEARDGCLVRAFVLGEQLGRGAGASG